MPSSCPKCHGVLEEDEICCAQVRYTWRCKSCFKLTTGFAIPYGKCFMCGGELEVIPCRDLGDSMRFRAIRDPLHDLEDNYHAHLDRSVVEISADEKNMISNWILTGLILIEESGMVELYQ